MENKVDLYDVNIIDNKRLIKASPVMYSKGAVMIHGKPVMVRSIPNYLRSRHGEILKMYLEVGLLTEVNKLKDYLKTQGVSLGGDLSGDDKAKEYLRYFSEYQNVYKHMLNDKSHEGRLKSLNRGNNIKSYYKLSILGYHFKKIKKKKAGKGYFAIDSELENKVKGSEDIKVITNLDLEEDCFHYLQDYVLNVLEDNGINSHEFRKGLVTNNRVIRELSEAYKSLCGRDILEEDYTQLLEELTEQHNGLTDTDIDEIKVLVNNKAVKRHIKETEGKVIRDEEVSKVELPKIKKQPKLKLPKGIKLKKPSRVDRILDMIKEEESDNVTKKVDTYEYTETLDELYDKYNSAEVESEVEEIKRQEEEYKTKEMGAVSMELTNEDVFGIEGYLKDNKIGKQQKEESEDKVVVVGNTSNTSKKPTEADVGESVVSGVSSPNLNFDAVDKVHSVFTMVGGKSPARDLYQLLRGKGVDVEVIKDFMSYKDISYYDFLNIERIVKTARQ